VAAARCVWRHAPDHCNQTDVDLFLRTKAKLGLLGVQSTSIFMPHVLLYDPRHVPDHPQHYHKISRKARIATIALGTGCLKNRVVIQLISLCSSGAVTQAKP
jgi:hypothetical protein